MRAVASIPTEYKGIMFRSRLEARWAAFFDAMGWPWVYEPIDRVRWIPDFSVTCAGATRYVEVKPAHSLEELSEIATCGRQLADAPDGTLLLAQHPFGATVGLVMHVSRSLGPKALEADRHLLRAIEATSEARSAAGKRTARVEHMAKVCGLAPRREVATGPLEADPEMIAKAWPIASNQTAYKGPAVKKARAPRDERILTGEEAARAAAAIITMLDKPKAAAR